MARCTRPRPTALPFFLAEMIRRSFKAAAITMAYAYGIFTGIAFAIVWQFR